ncbi:hypothetical protein EX30DRAFT_375746 [Ascodesmis nigricans]|uniref:Chitin-binding type-1 domain-containing protein n=1 Tax=Ascodesmis nigricans TaxID=341454 RepID=A0A4S2MPA6_9PEZI|nr:hypothetical protein EX30DRAFT_375746 [Ascodesmis nigricans]
MRISALLLTILPLLAAAQRCGTESPGGNVKCVAAQCCSEYSWCGTTSAYCNSRCQKPFGGPSAPSSCRPSTTATTSPTTFPSTIPAIDVCGGSTGVTCSGVGPEGYFYRCCSTHGHCGPKNSLQSSIDYCGPGCQPGAGKCDPSTPLPSSLLRGPPPGAPEAGQGEQCGPIVGRKCGRGLCCSGSNFCGSTAPFCGTSNWCQRGWGVCWGSDAGP